MKETRADILKVARRSFATIGFQKTTIEAIARMSNKGRRTIYTYFPNKTEIYAAVVEIEIQDIVHSLASICTPESSMSDNLRRYARVRTTRLTKLLDKNPMLRKSFLNKHFRIERLRETLDIEERKSLTNIISKYHISEIEKSLYHASDLACIFQSMLKSSDLMIGKSISGIEINKFVELNCDIFIRGIRKSGD